LVIFHTIGPSDLLHPSPAPPKSKKYKSKDDRILIAHFLTRIWNFLYETKQAAVSLISYRPTLLRSRNNSVDNAARLLARRPSNFSSILDSGNRHFSSPKHPDRPWDALSFLFSGYQRLFQRLKRPGPEADHSPTRLTILGAKPPFPHTLTWRRQGKLYLLLRTVTARQKVSFSSSYTSKLLQQRKAWRRSCMLATYDSVSWRFPVIWNQMSVIRYKSSNVSEETSASIFRVVQDEY